MKQRTSEPSRPHYTIILCGVGWFSVLITIISQSQKTTHLLCLYDLYLKLIFYVML